MPDKNFISYTGKVGYVESLVVDPTPGVEWSDALKFSNVTDSTFDNVRITRAGKEDGIDMNNYSSRNILRRWIVPCGKQALTLKGGSRDNLLIDWVIVGRGKHVELEFGNWSDQSEGLSTGNIVQRVRCDDGGPVRYAGRFGCLPKFEESQVKHVWWMSVGITLYFWTKYLISSKPQKTDGKKKA